MAQLPAEGATVDDYELPPGSPRWLTLADYDHRGEVLHFTITFKKTSREEEVQRPVDIVIVDKYLADQNLDVEMAVSQAMYVKRNVSERLETQVECRKDRQMSIIFYNPIKPGDDEDWFNATVRIRFDYYVDQVEAGEGFPFLTVLIVAFLIIAVVITIVLLVKFIRRRMKDASMFFDPEEGPYYVFRSILDSRIYYFDPTQYANLYNSSSLSDYEFVGTSTRIGGPITPPEYQGEAVPSQVQGIYAPTPIAPVAVDISVQRDVFAGDGVPPQGFANGTSAPVQDETVNGMGAAAGASTHEAGPEPGAPSAQELGTEGGLRTEETIPGEMPQGDAPGTLEGLRLSGNESVPVQAGPTEGGGQDQV